MDEKKRLDAIQALERQINGLPIGYISKKNINGKARYYHQWTEAGKKRSRYLRDGELEPLQKQIEERRSLQAELKKLQAGMPKQSQPKLDFETSVITGRGLDAMFQGVESWQRRDCFAQLEDYLYGSGRDRVCLVFGLRRTGKTTMLRQAIGRMTSEALSRAAYLKARRTDNMAMMNRDLKKLFDAGFQYVFIDEVTLMRDFIDSTAIFSDVFAAMGMKIVLSGTDSLGFWLAMDQELYDRAKPIHTTFIPYREYSRLLGINSIDEYIRYGGTLRAGETAFDDADANAQDASFRDDESTRRYIDTAICRNIQHSLACYEAGGHFRHLYSLYKAGELTSAINRIIEDMNHRFLISVLTEDFTSHDLRLTAANLRKERNPQKRTDVLDTIDTEVVTRRLMELLDIRNREEQSIGITQAHVNEIKEYLAALELIVDCPIETADPDAKPVEHILFTQPGMRYCQAQALVHALMKDETFAAHSELEKAQVTERILEEVRGRMMEDIVLLETLKAADRDHRVFKLQFAAGEFDMVIYNEKENSCEIFEIKHSGNRTPEQYRHLIDEEKCQQTERRFGPIRGRYVLYRGETAQAEKGVQYQNVESYLKELPNLDVCQSNKIVPQTMGPVL